MRAAPGRAVPAARTALAFIALLAGRVHAETLTVEQAVAIALENDPRLRSAALGVQRAEKSLAATRTRRYPDLDLQVQASQLLVPVSMTFPAGAFGSVDPLGPVPSAPTRVESSEEGTVYVNGRVVQPLSQLIRIGHGVRAQEIAVDLERQRQRQEELAVTNDVRRLYYTILANQRALEAALEQLEVDQELGRIVGDQVQREVVLASARMEVDAERAAQEHTILQLRGDLATAKENMNLLLGRPVDVPFSVTEPPDALPVSADWEDVQARALVARPDLVLAQLQQAQAEADRSSKKAEYIPDISLAFTYSSFFNVELLPQDISQIGLLLEWEPFDWGRKQHELGEKAAAIAQAEVALRAARDRALVEVRDRCRKFEEARSLLEARRLALVAAREKARVAANRQAEQAALLSDTLQAQASATAASAGYQQALLSLWTARADLEEVVGETL